MQPAVTPSFLKSYSSLILQKGVLNFPGNADFLLADSGNLWVLLTDNLSPADLQMNLIGAGFIRHM
jgi:hypothetical protein